MKIKTLEIKNFRCFKSLTISLENDLNIIVGTNGAGKSSILDALVLSLSDYASLFSLTESKKIQPRDRYEKRVYKSGGYTEARDAVELKIIVQLDQLPEQYPRKEWSWKSDSHTHHLSESV